MASEGGESTASLGFIARWIPFGDSDSFWDGEFCHRKTHGKSSGWFHMCISTWI